MIIPFTIKLCFIVIWSLSPGHFGLLVIVEKKGATILVGVTDPEHHGDVGLLLHNGGNSRDPLDLVLVLPWLF